LLFDDNIQKKRAIQLGVTDLKRKYNISDMVKEDVIFCATGVTDGELVNGIKDFGDNFLAETLVLHKSSKTNKIFKNTIKK
jgi:fructose-1,6-bisphosphatase II / sedoheptulose-1,7-bisphosphatase